MELVEHIKLEDEVKQILIDFETTRNDDMYLYYVYCCKKLKTLHDFSEVFSNVPFRKENKLATFAGVERARRKVQEKCPELQSDRKIKKARAKEEQEYKEYSRL